MAKEVIYLNNNYTNQGQNVPNPPQKRRHLGLILLAAILLLTMASMSLIRSYENLQKQVSLQNKATAQSKSLDESISLKSSEVKKLNDPDFLAKYARSAYNYSEPNEKIFNAPGLADGGTNP